MPPRTCDVVVVGAGLAGLACALRLSQQGLDVQVLEAEDAVGGRVRTDHVDGFLLDRGFQVLNTGYPEARRVLDLPALQPRRFTRGMVLHVAGTAVRLVDPRREPAGALRALRAPIGSIKDKAALGGYFAGAAFLPAAAVKRMPDRFTQEAWRRVGLSAVVVDRVLRPFLAGVLLETDMDTSARFTHLMVRMFVRGESVVPAAGMQAIPTQLEARLPAGSVHLSTPARTIGTREVATDEGRVSARAVVVATDADAAAGLLPRLEPRAWKGVTTVYHATDEAPLREPILVVDAETSPVNNTVVITQAAPSYAPPGRSLIATSLVHGRSGPPAVEDATLRSHLARLYGTDTSRWDSVATYDVPRALPSMRAPYRFRRPARVNGVYVCGDHRDTSSIQGALVSGRRVADAVLADLGVGSPG